MSDAKVTLTHKKNMKDNEPKKAPLLAKLKQITGVEYEFVTEPALDEFMLKIIKDQCPDHDRMGQAFYDSDGFLAQAVSL